MFKILDQIGSTENACYKKRFTSALKRRSIKKKKLYKYIYIYIYIYIIYIYIYRCISINYNVVKKFICSCK